MRKDGRPRQCRATCLADWDEDGSSSEARAAVQARSASPSGARPKAKAKGKAKAKAQPALAAEPPSAQHEVQHGPKKFGGIKNMWCPAYLKGNCKHSDEDCPFPHIDKAAKEVIQAKIQKNIADGKHQQ